MKKLCFLLALCLLTGGLVACHPTDGPAGGSSESESVSGDLSSPVILEGLIAATVSGIEVDSAMLAYMLCETYHTFVNENSYYLSYYGLDTSKSLREQAYMQEKDKTWFDYFLDLTKQDLNEILALAAEGKKQGITLTKQDTDMIDAYIDSMASYAKMMGYPDVATFIPDYYLEGVTEAAIRKALELELLATNTYQRIYESFTYQPEEMDEYLFAHPEHFQMVDYLYYTFLPECEKDATEEEYQAALAKAKQDAEAFRDAVDSVDSFVAKVKEIEGYEDLKASAFTVEGQLYGEEKRFTEWAFDPSRQVGDVGMIEEVEESQNEDGETMTEVYGYTVCYLLKTSYRLNYVTKNVRHILFTPDTYGSDEKAEAKAKEILTLYEGGEKTAEAFGELAKTYTEDGNGDVGGLYENVQQGQMVDTFNDWIYDSDRKEGDVGIVETDYGYHVMYFAGNGVVCWRIRAEGYLRQEDAAEALEGLKTTHSVAYDDAKIAEIPA